MLLGLFVVVGLGTVTKIPRFGCENLVCWLDPQGSLGTGPLPHIHYVALTQKMLQNVKDSPPSTKPCQHVQPPTVSLSSTQPIWNNPPSAPSQLGKTSWSPRMSQINIWCQTPRNRSLEKTSQDLVQSSRDSWGSTPSPLCAH